MSEEERNTFVAECKENILELLDKEDEERRNHRERNVFQANIIDMAKGKAKLLYGGNMGSIATNFMGSYFEHENNSSEPPFIDTDELLSDINRSEAFTVRFVYPGSKMVAGEMDTHSTSDPDERYVRNLLELCEFAGIEWDELPEVLIEKAVEMKIIEPLTEEN